LKITAATLKTAVLSKFPTVGFQWVPDKYFWVPFLAEVKAVVELTHVERMRFMENINDCDDYALQLHAQVNLYRADQARDMAIPSDEHFPWPFGEAFGIKFQGEEYQHSCNVVYTKDEGFQFIEPQTDEMWFAGAGDIVLCVKF